MAVWGNWSCTMTQSIPQSLTRKSSTTDEPNFFLFSCDGNSVNTFFFSFFFFKWPSHFQKSWFLWLVMVQNYLPCEQEPLIFTGYVIHASPNLQPFSPFHLLKASKPPHSFLILIFFDSDTIKLNAECSGMYGSQTFSHACLNCREHELRAWKEVSSAV